MNTKRVKAAGEVILAAQKRGHITASAWAAALEAACMLQSPETAAEQQALQARLDKVERAYVFDVAELRARVAELDERLATLRALCDAADQVGIVSGGWFTVEAVRRAASGEPLPKPDALTRTFTPVAALREDPHDSPLHHTYRLGRDLPQPDAAP
ncbi:hypothetical protein RFN58_07185 [Streptomyces iakyrus]|uniref:hypothetical protein n=1 Tax=Streptomyces iakyrus TaxID=68219 RepID=UPI0005248409|nr:hypothetical protein [Streptomyces iakyrus]